MNSLLYTHRSVFCKIEGWMFVNWKKTKKNSFTSSFYIFYSIFRKLSCFSNFPKHNFLRAVFNFHLLKRKSKNASSREGILFTRYELVTSLRRPKLVGFIYVSMRRCNDVSNRSVSLTYQLWRHDDIWGWSATSWPIQDLNETFLRRRMPGGSWFKP